MGRKYGFISDTIEYHNIANRARLAFLGPAWNGKWPGDPVTIRQLEDDWRMSTAQIAHFLKWLRKTGRFLEAGTYPEGVTVPIIGAFNTRRWKMVPDLYLNGAMISEDGSNVMEFYEVYIEWMTMWERDRKKAAKSKEIKPLAV